MGDERRLARLTRGRGRGLRARMSAADHHDVKLHLLPSHSRATRSIEIGPTLTPTLSPRERAPAPGSLLP